MQGVVLAAGEGTRLRPLTERKPKGLVEVGGQPLLTYCFEQLRDFGIKELVVVVGYRKEDIVNHYGNSFQGIPIQYMTQTEPRGLADALLAAAEAVEGDFMVINGDNIFTSSLEPCLARHRQTGATATLLTDTVTEERARGGATCRFDKQGRVTELVEKPDDPPSSTVVLGFYVLSPTVFDFCRDSSLSERGEYEITEALNHLIRTDYKVEFVEYNGWCINVNTHKDRIRAQARLG